MALGGHGGCAESESGPHREHAENDGEENVEHRGEGESILQGLQGIAPEGGEGGEPSKETGDEEGNDPGRMLVKKMAEHAANEKAPEHVADHDAQGKLVQGSPESEFFNAGREPPA